MLTIESIRGICASASALGIRGGPAPSEPYNLAKEEFDRAMAAHDAEVARKTLEDAAGDALLSSGRTFASREGFHDWLRARAASIFTDKTGTGE